MKINMKLLGASALAFALCGCGGSPAEKYAAPKIAEGAILAFEFDQRQIDKVQGAAIGEEKWKELTGQAWESAPQELVDVVKAAGLDGARARWGALSVGEPALKDDMELKDVPEMAVAIAIDIDIGTGGYGRDLKKTVAFDFEIRIEPVARN